MKRWLEESKGCLAVFKRIHGSLSRASQELVRAVNCKKRKAQSEVEKQQKAEERRRLSETKKLQKSLDKMTSSSCKDHIFFNPAGANLRLFTKLPVVTASEISSLGNDCPYMCIQGSELATFQDVVMQHCKQTLGVFAVQFPVSKQAKEKGRCRCPARMADSAVSKIQEILKPTMRDGVSFLKGGPDTAAAGSHGLAFFGYTQSMVYCGPEYNSTAAFRLADRGELICLRFATLWDAMSAERQGFNDPFRSGPSAEA